MHSLNMIKTIIVFTLLLPGGIIMDLYIQLYAAFNPRGRQAMLKIINGAVEEIMAKNDDITRSMSEAQVRKNIGMLCLQENAPNCVELKKHVLGINKQQYIICCITWAYVIFQVIYNYQK